MATSAGMTNGAPSEDIAGGSRPKSRGTVGSVRIIERHIRAGKRVGTLLVRAGCRSPDRVRLRDVESYNFTSRATSTVVITVGNGAGGSDVSAPHDTKRGRLSPRESRGRDGRCHSPRPGSLSPGRSCSQRSRIAGLGGCRRPHTRDVGRKGRVAVGAEACRAGGIVVIPESAGGRRRGERLDAQL